MGQEITCGVKFRGRRSTGRALLESDEIIFRGDSSFGIPFVSIKEIKVQAGLLRVKTTEGIVVFELAERAEKWRDRIQNPKSVIDKLGIRAGDTIRLHGVFDKQFRENVLGRGAKIVKDGIAAWIFLAAEDRAELCEVKSVVQKLNGASALWMVYPKGQKRITEKNVRETVLSHGLKDIKVVSFSDTHTALKFVRPKGSSYSF